MNTFITQLGLGIHCGGPESAAFVRGSFKGRYEGAYLVYPLKLIRHNFPYKTGLHIDLDKQERDCLSLLSDPSDDFRRSCPDMFSRYGAVLFKNSGHQSAPGEVVGSSEQASRSLLDSQNGFLGEELFFHSGDLQVVIQVSLHFFEA